MTWIPLALPPSDHPTPCSPLPSSSAGLARSAKQRAQEMKEQVDRGGHHYSLGCTAPPKTPVTPQRHFVLKSLLHQQGLCNWLEVVLITVSK
jgi:hypothetical protein